MISQIGPSGAANTVAKFTEKTAIDVGNYTAKIAREDIGGWGREQWEGLKRSGMNIKSIADSATTGNWNDMLNGLETAWPIDDIKGRLRPGRGSLLETGAK